MLAGLIRKLFLQIYEDSAKKGERLSVLTVDEVTKRFMAQYSKRLAAGCFTHTPIDKELTAKLSETEFAAELRQFSEDFVKILNAMAGFSFSEASSMSSQERDLGFAQAFTRDSGLELSREWYIWFYRSLYLIYNAWENRPKIRFVYEAVWYEVVAARVRMTEVVELPSGIRLKVEGWRSDTEFESLCPLPTYWDSVAPAYPITEPAMS